MTLITRALVSSDVASMALNGSALDASASLIIAVRRPRGGILIIVLLVSIFGSSIGIIILIDGSVVIIIGIGTT